MFGDLFEESGDSTTTSTEGKGKSPAVKSGSTSLPCPPAPRLKCGLAGIDNRGATCYMNALLQTLLLTPEFRESLFALGPSELGVLADQNKPGAKVRVIPIQLQRLFGRLLLLDQQSASTEELTDSFGWQNNEEFQQHDVQELNRILFSAVEDSLIGTSGQNLISRLYHGISVNKITCEVCGTVSEREEDFLDLTLAVAHYSGMEDTLKTCYVDVERMEGRNQYHCSSCNKLVDAVKSAKLRLLPPILTVSLLRFSFNYQKCERYKEIGKYIFPEEMDMSPYTEKTEASDDAVYELFSVLIHSGSTHGGHYHAYIKDIDGLGTWTTPEKEIIRLPSKPLPTPEAKVDLIELSSPQELLAALLRKRGGSGCKMPIDKLCQALSEETGVSWNKRFKRRFGSVTKFVKSCEELFSFDARTNSVCLKPSLQNLPVAAAVSQLSLSDRTISKSDPCLTSSKQSNVCETVAHWPHLPASESLPPYGRRDDDGCTSVSGGAGGDEPACGAVDGSGDAPPSAAPSKGSQVRGRTEQTPKNATPKNSPRMIQDSEPEKEKGTKQDKPNQVAELRTAESQKSTSGPCRDCRSRNSEEGLVQDKLAEPPSNSPCFCQANQRAAPDRARWFDFNDSRVFSIDDKSELPRQFSGRESAYMLLYRRKSMTRRKKDKADPHHGMPEWLVKEVMEANQRLAQQREEYDRVTNSIELALLQSNHYEYRASALHRKLSIDGEPVTLTLDRRRSVADLKMETIQVLGETALNGMSVNSLHLHTAQELPAGLHLYDCISDDNSAILQDLGLTSGTALFLWDGHKVDGMPLKTGPACAPVLVHLTYARTRDNRETAETSRGLARDLTVGELRALLSTQTEIPLGLLRLSRVLSEAAAASVIRQEEDGKTVEEMGLTDGDRIIAEFKRRGKASSLAENEALRQSRLVCLTVENRCLSVPQGTDWPSIPVEVDKDVTVAELKGVVISQLKQSEAHMLEVQCRLRVNAYGDVLQPPLQENCKIADAGIKAGAEVILEPGEPPREKEITVSFAVCCEGGQLNHQEVTVDKNSTVQETLEVMVGLAGVAGDQWHLRKANWCGEAAEFLQDPDVTLDQEGIANGGFLLLEEGRLPPKGFVRLPIWLYPSPDRGEATPPSPQAEMLQWINNHIMIVISSKSSNQGESSALGPDQSRHAALGNVELSQDATADDLKSQIQTLPAMSEVALPSPEFIRLRLVEGGTLGRVLRDDRQTLRRSKVTSASHIAVQILQEEEKLSSSAIVLNICQRIPETRTYGGKEELIWDTAKSATPQSLRQVIADRLLLPAEQIAIAKHLSQKYEWLVIQDQAVETKTGKGRGKRKGGGGVKPSVSLKQPPYSLKDGDTIGVKDLRFHPLDQDDFATEEDLAGKKRLEQEAEDKRKRRQELKENNAAWTFDGRRPKKPEVGLTIRVADFR
ncbi:LOW QUALITY PROTEIN: ubiquitin carboxyl-terminal hydrolase 40-like [Acanthaster planci]|uniref:LOW QUALITY PROTEIN: ubiquitin carboxyl-terminal hydrolase 40-like n=1 Tax=Acanthaster planci TaxID=133434 RepID=A0A8B7XYN9_ACAPL|nr:LOW QUALITY PROTEIN: ubiquitin carboxyl-terminal hydrolase 40-like [Acanthaster planci]